MRSTLRISFIFLVSFFTLHKQARAQSDGLSLRAGLSLRNGINADSPFLGYGLRVECPLSRHWYVNYNYSFTQSFSGVKLSHIPFTAMLAPVACQIKGKNSGPAILGLLLIAASVPEGFSYEINPDSKFRFIPFFNPFGLDRCIYLKEGKTNSTSWTYALNGGLECEADFSSRYYFSADLESTWFPDNGRVIPVLAMTIGMRFSGIDYGDMSGARNAFEERLNN